MFINLQLPGSEIGMDSNGEMSMSKFSEEIKKAIEESEQTLLSLADASGLSVDHISKMRRGVRLPQDTEKVQKLVTALQRSEEESRKLMTMYRIERMGDEEWSCMKGIQQLLEYGNMIGQQSKEMKAHAAEAGTHTLPTNVKALHNRGEVFTFLQRALPQTSGMLYMLTEEMSETVVDLLAAHLKRDDFSCVHLFSLKTLREKSGCLYNIRYVNRIMPLICCGRNYQPVYDYEEKGNAFLANWLISDHWAVGLQKDMEGGIVEWEPENINWLRRQFENRRKNKRQLLLYFSDVMQWGTWIAENRERYRAETVNGCVRPQDVKNYYLEYEPCTMMGLTDEMLQAHVLLPEPAKTEIITLFKTRREQDRSMDAMLFFTRKGIERFAKTGRISQFPDQVYTRLTIQERIQLLTFFKEWMQEPSAGIYMLDDRQINASYRTFLFSTVSLVHNEFTLLLGREGAEYISICEQGISEKLGAFCRMLESGEMVCPLEESVKAIEAVIADLEREKEKASFA